MTRTAITTPRIGLSCPAATLARATATLSRIIERRNTIPVLANFMVSVQNGQAILTGTDLDIEAKTSIPLETMSLETGDITIPGALLNDIIRKIPGDAAIALDWAPEEPQITLKSGRSRFALQSLPASDFPVLDAGNLVHNFSLPAPTLAEMLERVSFAISTEETRYYLNGVFLHAIDGKLRAVATNGHALAKFDIPLPEGAEDIPGIIVPRKTVAEFQRLATAEGKDGSVEISLSSSKIRAVFSNVTLTSKLIDGTFPDYQRVIPKGNPRKATLSKEALSSASGRIAAIAREGGRALKMAFAEGPKETGTLTLSMRSADSSEAEEILDTKLSAFGGPLETGFSARYLSDILGALRAPTVALHLDTPGSPALITEPGTDNFLIVLMPMRV